MGVGVDVVVGPMAHVIPIANWIWGSFWLGMVFWSKGARIWGLSLTIPIIYWLILIEDELMVLNV